MTAYIPVSGLGLVEVDLEDVPNILSHSLNWTNRSGYAISGKHEFMHNIIFNRLSDATTIRMDHIDQDKSNNKKSNLRLVTPQVNNYNTKRRIGASGYKGVRPYRGRFQAIMSVDNIQIYLGTFDDALDAALVYDRALTEWAGTYGVYNFA